MTEPGTRSLSNVDVYDRHMLYIGGNWVPGRGPRLHTFNPYTQQPSGRTVTASGQDVDEAVRAARTVVEESAWPIMRPAERAEYLERLYRIYADNLNMMHELICAQNGSPRNFGAQVTHPLEIIRQTAMFADLPVLFGRRAAGYEVRREPVGVVVAILPWNMPQKTLLMKLAPALLAGCAVIVKPAPETPLDALYLAEFADAAGLPKGVLSVLPINRDQSILEHLVTHPGVDKIAFTGSTETGAFIALLCAPDFRRLTLECGGKSAAVITEHADVDATVASLKTMSLANSGQICSNLTRLIVHETVHSEFVERMRAMMGNLKIGDPSEVNTDIGPLVSARQHQRVSEYLAAGHEQGKVTTFDQQTQPTGWFVYPTLITGVSPDATIAQHEIFGPVLTVHTYRTEREAIAIANGTRYGLAAAVYTADMGQADRMASSLKAGTVHINGAPAPIDAPLGGFRHSGIGRELGPEGVAHYQEIKVVAQ